MLLLFDRSRSKQWLEWHLIARFGRFKSNAILVTVYWVRLLRGCNRHQSWMLQMLMFLHSSMFHLCLQKSFTKVLSQVFSLDISFKFLLLTIPIFLKSHLQTKDAILKWKFISFLNNTQNLSVPTFPYIFLNSTTKFFATTKKSRSISSRKDIPLFNCSKKPLTFRGYNK